MAAVGFQTATVAAVGFQTATLIVRDKVPRQCPQITPFEDKEEPKRIRTEVPLLTSLTPYSQAKPARLRDLNTYTKE